MYRTYRKCIGKPIFIWNVRHRDIKSQLERTLIDKLRTGTYDGGTAWSSSDITVFGQFPEPEDVKYPCIVLNNAVNPYNKKYRLIDGKHRMAKMRQLGITSSKFYVLELNNLPNVSFI